MRHIPRWPIGGRLPKLPASVLASMPPSERADYYLKRSEVFGARAGFLIKVAIVFLVLSVIARVLVLVLP